MKPEWQGTSQHRDATDLSRWLVHLTRSEDDLISILKVGMIEARKPYGAGRHVPAVSDKHRSVCLTETPLRELHRMTARRPWGIVFDKERLRAKFGAQPVWYLGDPSPQWSAVEAAMIAARTDPTSPIWQLTPFMESVRDRESRHPNDWRWEREWRIRGDFEFDLTDIAMIVAVGDGAPAFSDEVSVGVPWMSPDDMTVRWSGGFTDKWEDEVDGMIDRFHEQFVSVQDAGMPWDSEDKEYVALVEILDTWDAMEEAFGQLAPELCEALMLALSDSSYLWCRTYDLEHIHE